MNSKNILEIGLLLPIITANIFGGIYYHELGFFNRRGIPIEFIQIESTLFLRFTAFFFALSLSILFILKLFSSYINSPHLTDEKKSNIRGRITGISALAFIPLSFFFFFKDVYFLAVSALIGIFLSYQFKFKRRPGNITVSVSKIKNYLSDDPLSTSNFLKSPVLLSFIKALQFFCFICIIAFLQGYFFPRDGALTYTVKKGTSYITLRKYSTYSILGTIDSNNIINEKNFVIQYSPTSADTITMVSALKN